MAELFVALDVDGGVVTTMINNNNNNFFGDDTKDDFLVEFGIFDIFFQ